MAQQSVRRVKNNATSPGELKITDLSQGQGLTDRYDHLLMALFDTSPAENISGRSTNHNNRFCHHIRHALNADTAYLCNRNSLTIVATSSSDGTQECCDDTQEIHTSLLSMVSDLWNCTDSQCRCRQGTDR